MLEYFSTSIKFYKLHISVGTGKKLGLATVAVFNQVSIEGSISDRVFQLKSVLRIAGTVGMFHIQYQNLISSLVNTDFFISK